MALKAYQYYRLLLTKNGNGNNGYFTINEFGLYERDQNGVNLALGATASAHSSYSGTTGPKRAIDGDPATFWESTNQSVNKWILISLSEPRYVRTIYLSSTTYTNEVPADWILQGSNDLVVWDDIFNMVAWVTSGVAKSSYEKINIAVSGNSKLETGAPSSRVLLHDWATGAFVASLVPNSDGSWFQRMRNTSELMVTHIGPSGFQPWCDGPVTPQED